MAISAREAELLTWLERQYEPMVGLLGDLVNVDSGSFDAAGVARAGEVIAPPSRGSRHRLRDDRAGRRQRLAQGDGGATPARGR